MVDARGACDVYVGMPHRAPALLGVNSTRQPVELKVGSVEAFVEKLSGRKLGGLTKAQIFQPLLIGNEFLEVAEYAWLLAEVLEPCLQFGFARIIFFQ